MSIWAFILAGLVVLLIVFAPDDVGDEEEEGSTYHYTATGTVCAPDMLWLEQEYPPTRQEIAALLLPDPAGTAGYTVYYGLDHPLFAFHVAPQPSTEDA